MMKSDNDFKEVALFPLNVLLLPGSYGRLHIFEERYKQLINDCENGMAGFGIAYAVKADQKSMASWVQLHSIDKRLPNGEMDVTVYCSDLCEVNSISAFMGNKPYPGGYIKVMHDSGDAPVPIELQAELQRFSEEVNLEWTETLTDKPYTLYELATVMGLNDAEKLEFVLLESTEQRVLYLINYLRYLKFLEKQEQSVYKSIYLN